MSRKAKSAVFVDRDGTICFDKHYLSDPGGLKLVPTVAQGIRALNEAGIQTIVVTNQSGIGRGYFGKEQLETIHNRLREILASYDARIDDIFYCPHRPDEGCSCRKPAPGMLLQAKDKYGLDLSRSFVIGDRMMDVEMAHRVGAKGILVPEPGDQYNVDEEVANSPERPDFRASSFLGAVNWIIGRAKAKGHE